MDDKMSDLIDALLSNNANNNVLLICTILTCIIALVSVLISLSLFFLQLKDRLLKRKVLGYIYEYFAPLYIVDKLPTTIQIQNDLKCIFFTKKDVFNMIIELNKENLITAVGDLSTSLENIKWKPNTIYHDNKKKEK